MAATEHRVRYSSAGPCAQCGLWADKRYGGEGRYLPMCATCWTAGTSSTYKAVAKPCNTRPPSRDIPR